MRFFTCYALSDGNKKWLTIDQLPAMQGEFVNEVTRVKLYRPGLVIVCIILDWNVSINDATSLVQMAFDNPDQWLTIELKKPLPQPEIKAKKARYGRR